MQMLHERKAYNLTLGGLSVELAILRESGKAATGESDFVVYRQKSAEAIVSGKRGCTDHSGRNSTQLKG